MPGLADATVIAPERKASPLPSPRSEVSSAGLFTPNIVISADSDTDRPQSPETLIPATDTLTTRPIRGGVAYPFSLRVEGKDAGDANASTLTLQSVSVATPAVEEFSKEDKELGAPVDEGISNDVKEVERPGVERFVTAGVGELKGVGGEGTQQPERPGVERFETAQEDLSTLANGKA